MDENSKTATVAECAQPFLSGRACLKCAHCEREGKKIAAQLLADPAFRKRLLMGIFKESVELFLRERVDASFKACLEAGGVPIMASPWAGGEMNDCKFPPMRGVK